MNNPAAPAVDELEMRLVGQAAGGDRAAQHQLFERYRGLAFGVALRITGRREDAMDVVQDSFVRAFERLGEFHAGASFRSWLLRIVSNRALDLLRARKVRLAVPIDTDEDDAGAAAAVPTDEISPGERLERAELGERLKRAIETLPPDQRSVFSMYASGEMTYGEIAAAVGIPIGTVMSRLYHARRKLHQLLPDLAPSGAVTRE